MKIAPACRLARRLPSGLSRLPRLHSHARVHGGELLHNAVEVGTPGRQSRRQAQPPLRAQGCPTSGIAKRNPRFSRNDHHHPTCRDRCSDRPHRGCGSKSSGFRSHIIRGESSRRHRRHRPGRGDPRKTAGRHPGRGSRSCTVMKPYRLVAQENEAPQPPPVAIGEVRNRDWREASCLSPGPCSVESKEQLLSIAGAVKAKRRARARCAAEPSSRALHPTASRG